VPVDHEPPRTARTEFVLVLSNLARPPLTKFTSHAPPGVSAREDEDQTKPAVVVQLQVSTVQPAVQLVLKAGDTAR